MIKKDKTHKYKWSILVTSLIITELVTKISIGTGFTSNLISIVIHELKDGIISGLFRILILLLIYLTIYGVVYFVFYQASEAEAEAAKEAITEVTTVLTKTQDNRRHRSNYFVTFELPSKERLHMEVPIFEYGKLIEGDEGELTYKIGFLGNKYQSFKIFND